MSVHARQSRPGRTRFYSRSFADADSARVLERERERERENFIKINRKHDDTCTELPS